jgi:hypothetical protein
MRFRLTIFFLVFWADLVCRAATYYVSTAGSDSSSGLLQAPWRTLSKAAATVASGDTVLVYQGIYPERIRLGQDGTASNRIIDRIAPCETPVFP